MNYKNLWINNKKNHTNDNFNRNKIVIYDLYCKYLIHILQSLFLKKFIKKFI